MSQDLETSLEELEKIIFKIVIKLPDGSSVQRNFASDVKIDYEILEDQLADTPARFAFWASVLAEQKSTVAILERKISRRRAVLSKEFFDAASKDGYRVTKYMVDELIESDEAILRLQGKLIMEQKLMLKIQAIVDALKLKSEHLRSLAGFKRQEMRDA